MANAKKPEFTSVSAALDRDLAKRAINKKTAGQTPSATELAALKRLEKEQNGRGRNNSKGPRAPSYCPVPIAKPGSVPNGSTYWKTWVHQRLTQPLDKPGAMTFFQAPRELHTAMTKHLAAEVKSEEFVPGKGVVVKWNCLRRQNHFFDALYYASAAGWYCGVRLPDEKPAVKAQPVPLGSLGQGKRPDGRPWIDLDRWHGVRG